MNAERHFRIVIGHSAPEEAGTNTLEVGEDWELDFKRDVTTVVRALAQTKRNAAASHVIMLLSRGESIGDAILEALETEASRDAEFLAEAMPPGWK